MTSYVASAAVALVCGVAVAEGGQTNMNPVDYVIANPATPGAAVRNFRGEFFEFYGNVKTTRYSEVHWSSSTVQLPKEIVARFDGKVMAITGIETDIVRKVANGSDERVPCWEQYNHHYSNWMHGKSAFLLKEPQELLSHAPMHHMASDSQSVSEPTWGFADALGSGIPRVQVFSEGNGNEHQGSYKGYARGFAQLIESPVTFMEGPMLINTNKRLTNDTSPGHINNQLLPRYSLAPPSAGYSGIAECPCTSRKPKILDAYLNQSSGACAFAVESPQECVAAWKKVGGQVVSVVEVHSDEAPSGCHYNSDALAFTADASSTGSLIFNYNNGASCDHQTCICRDPKSKSGTINGARFHSPCAPYPTSDLIKTNNSICDIRAYNGGLRCCTGGSLLLDVDQEVPAPTDSFFMKYRFYFEEYTTQQNTFRVWWSTEARNNEYDVPKSSANCLDPTTPKEDCEHTIRSVFHGVDMLGLSGCMMQGDINSCGNVTRIKDEDAGLFQLTYAGAHCHAPACTSMELWNEDTKELLCEVKAVFGTEAQCEMKLPPCVWGSAAEGLKLAPILHLNSNLTVVKRANNTNGHWGTMALWQMRAAYVGKSAVLV